MIYEFKCTDCGFVLEVIQSMQAATFEDRTCPKCGKSAKHMLEAPAVATSGMSNAPIDVVVGRDAEARWSDIRRRQALRDKVRKESGETAVSMTGRNEFSPIKSGRREFVKVLNDGLHDD
jgi:putative FmdB family regulatory protein